MKSHEQDMVLAAITALDIHEEQKKKVIGELEAWFQGGADGMAKWWEEQAGKIADANVQLRDQAEKAVAERERAEAACAQMRAALAKHAGCRTVHVNSPVGTTCIDIRNDARNRPEGYTVDFGRSVAAGEHLCTRCQVTILLAATDVGAGWVSSEEHGKALAACAQMREALMETKCRDS